MRKDAKFEWKVEEEQAFERLKAKLTNQPILKYPNFTMEFILNTDVSNTGLGAVLSQGPLGKDLPIAYASRILNKTETKYTTSEKELLAIVWATKYFRPYLYGMDFKVVTDHKPLTWIMNVQDPRSRLLRWIIQLEEFDYEIEYKKGSLNTNADALNRVNSVVTEKESGIELDEESNKQIFYEFHDAPVGGHRCMNRTLRSIKARYTSPNMRQVVEKYVKQCNRCQVNKMLETRRKYRWR